MAFPCASAGIVSNLLIPPVLPPLAFFGLFCDVWLCLILPPALWSVCISLSHTLKCCSARRKRRRRISSCCYWLGKFSGFTRLACKEPATIPNGGLVLSQFQVANAKQSNQALKVPGPNQHQWPVVSWGSCQSAATRLQTSNTQAACDI